MTQLLAGWYLGAVFAGPTSSWLSCSVDTFFPPSADCPWPMMHIFHKIAQCTQAMLEVVEHEMLSEMQDVRRRPLYLSLGKRMTLGWSSEEVKPAAVEVNLQRVDPLLVSIFFFFPVFFYDNTSSRVL
jgi:hypothetical protein